MFDVPRYYRATSLAFPDLHHDLDLIQGREGTDLYTFLWNVVTPIVVNVGMHGSRMRRKEVFKYLDLLLTSYPELANEIGVGMVEVAPDGWFEVAMNEASETLMLRLDVWEPGWRLRSGPPKRTPDPYDLERKLRNPPTSDRN